jgi:hypothetical protein
MVYTVDTAVMEARSSTAMEKLVIYVVTPGKEEPPLGADWEE